MRGCSIDRKTATATHRAVIFFFGPFAVSFAEALVVFFAGAFFKGFLAVLEVGAVF